MAFICLCAKCTCKRLVVKKGHRERKILIVLIPYKLSIFCKPLSYKGQQLIEMLVAIRRFDF